MQVLTTVPRSPRWRLPKGRADWIRELRLRPVGVWNTETEAVSFTYGATDVHEPIHDVLACRYRIPAFTIPNSQYRAGRGLVVIAETSHRRS